MLLASKSLRKDERADKSSPSTKTRASPTGVSRKLWKDTVNHKLNTVAEALGFDFHHHQALDDARACEYIVRKALEQTELPSVEALMKATGQTLKPFAIDRGKKKLKI